MIEECNFKSKIRHRDSSGCNLTPNDIVCSGEKNCILYQIYKKLEMNKLIISWKDGYEIVDLEEKKWKKCVRRVDILRHQMTKNRAVVVVNVSSQMEN